MENRNELKEEFKSKFAGIEWNDQMPMDEILAKHVTEFTREQWEAIADRKYSSLFTSWGGDVRQSSIVGAIQKNFAMLADRHSEGTWYSVVKRYYDVNGVKIMTYYESPNTFSGGSRLVYSVSIVKDEDVPEPNDYIAVIFGNDSCGIPHIIKYCNGSESYCEDWLAENIKRTGAKYWKLMKRDYKD